jgi:hypothetical protein
MLELQTLSHRKVICFLHVRVANIFHLALKNEHLPFTHSRISKLIKITLLTCPLEWYVVAVDIWTSVFSGHTRMTPYHEYLMINISYDLFRPIGLRVAVSFQILSISLSPNRHFHWTVTDDDPRVSRTWVSSYITRMQRHVHVCKGNKWEQWFQYDWLVLWVTWVSYSIETKNLLYSWDT